MSSGAVWLLSVNQFSHASRVVKQVPIELTQKGVRKSKCDTNLNLNMIHTTQRINAVVQYYDTLLSGCCSFGLKLYGN